MTDPSGTINLNHSIPTQNMKLRTVRVEMKTNAHAVANPIINIDLSSLFGPSQINNSSSNNSYLPVFNQSMDPTYVAFISQYDADLSIGLQKNVPESFRYAIYATDGLLITSAELTSIDLIFEYNKGGIV